MDISLIMKLVPLWPRIEKAMATESRIAADPDVQDAIALSKEIIQIVTAHAAQQSNSPGLQGGGATG